MSNTKIITPKEKIAFNPITIQTTIDDYKTFELLKKIFFLRNDNSLCGILEDYDNEQGDQGETEENFFDFLENIGKVLLEAETLPKTKKISKTSK
jgi:hypothetical protein